MKNKKILLALSMALLTALPVFARPGHGGSRIHHGARHRPPPARVHHHHHPVHHHHHPVHRHYHRGSHFWPAFAGSFVGNVISTSIVSPRYVTEEVWVEGRYIDQIQSDGTIIRVWQPGHFERRQVLRSY